MKSATIRAHYVQQWTRESGSNAKDHPRIALDQRTDMLSPIVYRASGGECGLEAMRVLEHYLFAVFSNCLAGQDVRRAMPAQPLHTPRSGGDRPELDVGRKQFPCATSGRDS